MKAVVDRIEGSLAVVLCGDREIRVDIPLELLPARVEEGDWLTLRFEAAPGLTADRRQRIRELLDRLKKK